MPRRRMSQEARDHLVRRQAALTGLSRHPSWPDFEEEIDLKGRRIEKHILARTLGGTEPISEMEIYYWRGFIQGMRWLAAVPTGAENRLEQFLRSQGVQLPEGVSVEQ